MLRSAERKPLTYSTVIGLCLVFGALPGIAAALGSAVVVNSLLSDQQAEDRADGVAADLAACDAANQGRGATRALAQAATEGDGGNAKIIGILVPDPALAKVVLTGQKAQAERLNRVSAELYPIRNCTASIKQGRVVFVKDDVAENFVTAVRKASADETALPIVRDGELGPAVVIPSQDTG